MINLVFEFPTGIGSDRGFGSYMQGPSRRGIGPACQMCDIVGYCASSYRLRRRETRPPRVISASAPGAGMKLPGSPRRGPFSAEPDEKNWPPRVLESSLPNWVVSYASSTSTISREVNQSLMDSL